MAFTQIAGIAPNYRDYKNWWLKAYEPGTTTPKLMSDNNTGSPTSAKYEVNSDGFIVSSGGTLITPHIDGDYDLWLFPTVAEADANDTTNAERLADDLENYLTNTSLGNSIGGFVSYEFDTVADAKIGLTIGGQVVTLKAGDVIRIKERSSALFDVVSGKGAVNGFNIIAHATLDLSFVLRVNEEAYADQFGAVDGTDISSALAVMDDYCRNKGVKFVWNVSGFLNDTYRHKTGKYEMDFTGSVITSNKTTTGFAYEFAPDDDGVTPPIKNTVYKIKGFFLQAGAISTDANRCSGLAIGRASNQSQGESSRIQYENLVVRGAFSYNVWLLDELFINAFINPEITGGWNGCVRVLTQVNAGENINVHGGVIANAHNDTYTGVNLLMDIDSNCDMYFSGTSIDYGDVQLVMRSGAVTGTIHFESNTENTDIQLIETNNQPITFNLIGGTIASGPNPSQAIPEPANGKASRIEIDGSKINCNLMGVGNSLRDKFDTEIITVNSGSPVASIRGIFYDTSVDKPAILSRYLTRIRNGEFENNITQSWQLNGTTGASIATSNEEAFRGIYSLKFNGTAGGSFSAVQTLMPTAGVKYLIRAQMKLTEYTSGYMELLINFKDWQGNLVGSRTASAQPAAVADWVLVADNAPIPAPTYEIEVQVKAVSFIGTAYVDDIVLNVIE